MMSAKYVYHIHETISDLISVLNSELVNSTQSKEPEDVPLIQNVDLLKSNLIIITFTNNIKKIYDVTECLRNEKYRSKGTENIADEDVINTIQVANDGYYLRWLDNIRFRSAYALWTEGYLINDINYDKKDGELDGNDNETE